MTTPPERGPLRAELLALLAEDARRSAGSPVEPEELVAYLEGSLEPEDQRRILHRILGDPETAHQLLDLEDLLAAETGRVSDTRDVADFAMEAGWRDLEPRLAAADESGESAATTPRSGSGLRMWQSAAAVGLMVSALLGARLATFQPQVLVADAGPQPAVTLDLVADLRGPGESPTVTVAEGARLHLEISPTERCPEYNVEIERPGESAKTSLELTPNERGALVLGLAGEPGEYRLRVTGCDPPREIEQHRFRVERPALPPKDDGA